jgi:hypothetical protein
MGASKDTAKKSRTDRLRAALRENLKRRKAQARGRAGERAPAAAAETGSAPDSPDFRRNRVRD